MGGRGQNGGSIAEDVAEAVPSSREENSPKRCFARGTLEPMWWHPAWERRLPAGLWPPREDLAGTDAGAPGEGSGEDGRSFSATAAKFCAEFWQLHRERQRAIDVAIARLTDTDLLYD